MGDALERSPLLSVSREGVDAMASFRDEASVSSVAVAAVGVDVGDAGAVAAETIAAEAVEVSIAGSDSDSDSASGENCCLPAAVAGVAEAAAAGAADVTMSSDSCHGLPGDSFPEFDDEMEELELCEMLAKLWQLLG